MKIRVFEAFAGYGSTAIALKRLQRDFPDDVEFEFVGISEIEPKAISAYRNIHGDVLNYGDICKIDWGQIPDFICLPTHTLAPTSQMRVNRRVLRRGAALVHRCYGSAEKQLR